MRQATHAMLWSVDVILSRLGKGGSQKDFCKSDTILVFEGGCGNVEADLQGSMLGAGRPVRGPCEARQNKKPSGFSRGEFGNHPSPHNQYSLMVLVPERGQKYLKSVCCFGSSHRSVSEFLRKNGRYRFLRCFLTCASGTGGETPTPRTVPRWKGVFVEMSNSLHKLPESVLFPGSDSLWRGHVL